MTLVRINIWLFHKIISLALLLTIENTFAVCFFNCVQSLANTHFHRTKYLMNEIRALFLAQSIRNNPTTIERFSSVRLLMITEIESLSNSERILFSALEKLPRVTHSHRSEKMKKKMPAMLVLKIKYTFFLYFSSLIFSLASFHIEMWSNFIYLYLQSILSRARRVRAESTTLFDAYRLVILTTLLKPVF